VEEPRYNQEVYYDQMIGGSSQAPSQPRRAGRREATPPLADPFAGADLGAGGAMGGEEDDIQKAIRESMAQQ